MKTLLWLALPVLFLGAVSAHIFASDIPGLLIILLLLMLGSIVGLLVVHWKDFRKSTLAYGTNSIILSLLVLGLVGVANYLAFQHLATWDLDLTKNKVHTLSDQTAKLVRNLKTPLKANLYGNPGDREKLRILFDKMRGLSPQVQVEFVDINREITKVKQAGVKRTNTLVLSYNGKEQKVEEPSEEKIANALAKLSQEKSKTVCAIKGHGEKPINGNEVEGYMALSKGLKDQGYETQELNLFEQAKIPENCETVFIGGPEKPFLDKEATQLKDYLNSGGRALVLLDINLKGNDPNPELNAILEKWYIRPLSALVVDPLMQKLGGDAATIQVQSYSKSHAITKDFQIPVVMQLVRPLEIITGAPAGVHADWLAQTLPTAWGETDLKGLGKGAVSNNKGVDKPGPLPIAAAVEGKQPDTKAPRSTRIVVIGNSGFVGNGASRFGGNLDFVLNSFSWLLEDENSISVRAREEEPGKLELDANQGRLIFWITVILIPLAVVVMGVGVWFRRRGM